MSLYSQLGRCYLISLSVLIYTCGNTHCQQYLLDETDCDNVLVRVQVWKEQLEGLAALMYYLQGNATVPIRTICRSS